MIDLGPNNRITRVLAASAFDAYQGDEYERCLRNIAQSVLNAARPGKLKRSEYEALLADLTPIERARVEAWVMTAYDDAEAARRG